MVVGLPSTPISVIAATIFLAAVEGLFLSLLFFVICSKAMNVIDVPVRGALWQFRFAGLFLILTIFAPMASAQSPDAIQFAVGKQNFTQSQIQFQMSASSCLGDSSPTRARAAARLIAQALESEVLDQYFKDHPADSLVRKKAEYIRATTKDPGRLKCILATNDEKSYLNLFVRPTMISPRIRYRYSKDSAAHPGEIRSFDQWYRPYVLEHVPIRFSNHALQDEVMDAYGSAWWIRAIKNGS